MTRQGKGAGVAGAMWTFASRALWLSGLLLGGVTSMPAAAGEDRDRDDGPVVQTAEGPVRGFVKNGVYEFLGIPYAAQPVGGLRWMPPQPVAPWGAPRDATAFGNICAQVTTLAVVCATASVAEARLLLQRFATT